MLGRQCWIFNGIALTAHIVGSEVRGAAPQFGKQGGLGLYQAAFRSKACAGKAGHLVMDLWISGDSEKSPVTAN